MEGDKVKTLVIMRGLPGSGKSTKAKQLAGQKGLIYSTDDFFMVDGKYIYDATKIVQYHSQNLQRTKKAMLKQEPLIVVDNTNICLWQMRKYVEAAEQLGYNVRVQQPGTPWAFNYKKCAKNNTHGVPEDIVKRMLNNYETFNNLSEIKAAEMKKRNKK